MSNRMKLAIIAAAAVGVFLAATDFGRGKALQILIWFAVIALAYIAFRFLIPKKQDPTQ